MATWVRETRSVFEQERRKRQVDMEAYARENILWLDRYLNDAISILEAYVGWGERRRTRGGAREGGAWGAENEGGAWGGAQYDGTPSSLASNQRRLTDKSGSLAPLGFFRIFFVSAGRDRATRRT